LGVCMRVLIACASSGKERDEFIKLGHEAVSCDLLPCSTGGDHYQGDVRDIINDGWDLMIAHPDCTYLTNSAEWAYADVPMIKGKPRNMKTETLIGAERREAREEALEFVRFLLNAKIEKIALENPRGVIGTRIRKADQWIQPHQFGDDASKITGLWLKNLPLLIPTKNIAGRIVEWPRGSGKLVERWANQTDSGQNKLTPSEDRWKIRAETYNGWSKAFAEQWGRP